MKGWLRSKVLEGKNRRFFKLKKQADLSRPDQRQRTISVAVDVTIDHYSRALQKLADE